MFIINVNNIILFCLKSVHFGFKSIFIWVLLVFSICKSLIFFLQLLRKIFPGTVYVYSNTSPVICFDLHEMFFWGSTSFLLIFPWTLRLHQSVAAVPHHSWQSDVLLISWQSRIVAASVSAGLASYSPILPRTPPYVTCRSSRVVWSGLFSLVRRFKQYL